MIPQEAPRSPSEHRLAALSLVAIMALAAWLRLGDLGLVEFKQDEVKHLRLAEAVLDGQVALTGSSASVGIPKPPGMTYLMAIPRAVSRVEIPDVQRRQRLFNGISADLGGRFVKDKDTSLHVSGDHAVYRTQKEIFQQRVRTM